VAEAQVLTDALLEKYNAICPHEALGKISFTNFGLEMPGFPTYD
jgi:hypothetical protein